MLSILGKQFKLYTELNDIIKCREIFDSISKKNSYIFNAMLHAYNENKMYNDTMELFMSKEMIRYRTDVSCNISIQACAKLKEIDKCEIIFKGIVDKNAASYNIMMQAYNENGMYSQTVEMFLSENMEEYRNNPHCCTAVIKAYAKLNNIYQCETIFNSAKKKNKSMFKVMMQIYNDNDMYRKTIELFESKEMENCKNTIICNMAIRAYFKCNNIDECETIFSSMEIKNKATYGTMMQGYNDWNMYYKCIELFHSIENASFKDEISYNIVMQAYSNLNDIHNCEKIFNSVENKNVILYNLMMQCYNDNKLYHKCIQLFGSNEFKRLRNNMSSHIVIGAYSRINDVNNCEIIFNNIEDKNDISYSVMMNAYRMNGKYQASLDLFDKLANYKRNLTSQIFCNALYSCGDIIALNKGREIIHKLNNKYNRHLVSYEYILAAIISMYGKCTDSLIETRKIYDIIIMSGYVIREIDILQTSIMDCYAKSGDMDSVLYLFNQLKQSNIKISDETYSIVMNCCAHSGNIETATQIFDEYLKTNNYKITKTYLLTPIIDGFGRNNELDKAQHYYNKYSNNIIHYKDKILMLRSILSSSKLHNDIKRTHQITHEIVKLYQDNNDSNIHPFILPSHL